MDSNIRWLLMLEGFKVGRFTLKKAEVGEKAEVSDVTVMDKGEITGVNVKELRLNGVSWPTSKTEVILEGNKYTDIVVGSKNEKSSWETVVRLFEGAVYNQENYATYEKVLRQQGLVEEADNVYMARRDRELSEMLVGWSYAKNLFLGVLAGYGKNPEYAFYWSIVVVVLGCWVFKRQRMRPVDDRTEELLAYSAFWYSLNLFLPVIDLHGEAKWVPRKEVPLVVWYWRTHMILGWLLIPISVAAWTGLLD